MNHILTKQASNPNICLSGGASGADLEWGSCASAAGHEVIHWSFQGHNTTAPENTVIRLSDEDLSLAESALSSATRVLGKSPPRKAGILRLLKRNYFQVAWASSCYAVTVIRDAEKGERVGGTAWATTMFSLLHPESRSLYLFDMERDGWVRWDPAGEEWIEIESPPRPRGVWAGIGSRELSENGKMAIRRLMGCLDMKEEIM
ncbi:uncharacterized protein BDV14DRAFT_170405 [Aspergillus stella-maris]|uniref:uncharacterized protein n=1 Tax=Aspergillus stella-maris TaxID=1810926 RepID=UPI003CCE4775